MQGQQFTCVCMYSELLYMQPLILYPIRWHNNSTLFFIPQIYISTFLHSPLFKKLSAKRKAAAAPSTVIKDGSSVVLSPSKIPRLSPSSPLGSGIKRLRSVSLERLSSDHMTKPKRKSGSRSSSGEAGENIIHVHVHIIVDIPI